MKAINWNRLEDVMDKAVYEKLTEQFWLSTRIPLSNDLDDWRKLSEEEKSTINRAFAGLTMLDTLQSEVGAVALIKDSKTQHEKAVYANIHFMEAEHARSYSSIFTTFNTPTEIDQIFEWSEQNELLQKKAAIIEDIYQNGTAIQKKIASVFLESFLFYSGFFTPLWYLGNNKLPNIAEIIKLILRDEASHGTYIGYKFQVSYNDLSEDEQAEILDWAYELLYKLYENEVLYTHELYDEIGWTDEVIKFLEYNANKALMNLGLDPLFATTEQDVNPIIMNGISTGTSNHDFFSQVGNGYLLGQVEAMTDEDYDYGNE